MADIELIIKMPEEIRVAITRMGLLRIPDEMQKKVDKAIQRGTPLEEELHREKEQAYYLGYEDGRKSEWTAAAEVEQQESEKVNCKSTKCENCINHNYCDYEPLVELTISERR